MELFASQGGFLFFLGVHSNLRATLETFLGLVLPECARKGHSSMPAVRLSSLDLQTNDTVAILMPMPLKSENETFPSLA